MLHSLSLFPVALSSTSLLCMPLCHCFNHSPNFFHSSSFGLALLKLTFRFAFWVPRFSDSLSLVRHVCSPPFFFALLSLWFHSLYFCIQWFWQILYGFVFTGLLSLSLRGMFSYLYLRCIICMLGLFSICLYHRFWDSKILGRKNFK